MIFSKNSGEIAAASAGSAIIKDINAMQGFGNMDVLCMERYTLGLLHRFGQQPFCAADAY